MNLRIGDKLKIIEDYPYGTTLLTGNIVAVKKVNIPLDSSMFTVVDTNNSEWHLTTTLEGSSYVRLIKCCQGTEGCKKTSTTHQTCAKWVEHRDTVVEVDLGRPTAVKADDGKPDLSQVSRELMELVARVRMFGAKKYARNNWKKGFKITRSLAAALRHIFAYLAGEDNDPESGLSHLGHAICSLEHAVYDSIHHKENDDRSTDGK